MIDYGREKVKKFSWRQAESILANINNINKSGDKSILWKLNFNDQEREHVITDIMGGCIYGTGSITSNLTDLIYNKDAKESLVFIQNVMSEQNKSKMSDKDNFELLVKVVSMRHPEEIKNVARLCKDNGRLTKDVAEILLRERFSEEILREVLDVILDEKGNMYPSVESVLKANFTEKYKGQLIGVLQGQFEAKCLKQSSLCEDIEYGYECILRGNHVSAEMHRQYLGNRMKEYRQDTNEQLKLYIEEIGGNSIFELVDKIDLSNPDTETVEDLIKMQASMIKDQKLLEDIGIDTTTVVAYNDQPESAKETAPKVCEDDQL